MIRTLVRWNIDLCGSGEWILRRGEKGCEQKPEHTRRSVRIFVRNLTRLQTKSHRIILKNLCSTVLVLSAILLSSLVALAQAAWAQENDGLSIPTNCIADQTAISDVLKAKSELAAKRKELAEQEAELKAREAALSEEFKKLLKARNELLATQDERKKVNEEKLSKFVETVLSMSPKAASKLLSSVEESLAVAAIYQMDTQRLGKILNVMETNTSSKLTELMVGVIKSKGGETNDRKNERLVGLQRSEPTPRETSSEPARAAAGSPAGASGSAPGPSGQVTESKAGGTVPERAPGSAQKT